jgi:hypothetical protein
LRLVANFRDSHNRWRSKLPGLIGWQE